MRKSRKTIIISGTVAGVLVGGAAFAYWTSTGTGTGSASTSAGAAVTVAQEGSVTNLRPGGAAAPVSAKVTNPTDTTYKVSQVVVSISGVTKAANAVGACDTSDYTLSGATMTTGAAEIAPTGNAVFSGASISFNNKPSVDQDGCKGATVNLAFAAS